MTRVIIFGVLLAIIASVNSHVIKSDNNEQDSQPQLEIRQPQDKFELGVTDKPEDNNPTSTTELNDNLHSRISKLYNEIQRNDKVLQRLRYLKYSGSCGMPLIRYIHHLKSTGHPIPREFQEYDRYHGLHF